MTGPRISVLIPAYNAEATVRDAVTSALAQTVGDLEVIVVDDASRIPAREALEGLGDERLRIVEHERNRGPGPARNTALRHCRAPLVGQLDADDLWEPGYAEAILPCFEDPRVGAAYTNAAVFGMHEHPYITDPSRHPLDHFPALAQDNGIPNCATTVRRAAVERIGGYPEFTRGAQDWYVLLRLAGAGWRFAFVDRPLARYRWTGTSLSENWDAVQTWNLQVLSRFMLHHPLTRGTHRQVARLAFSQYGKRLPGARRVKAAVDARRAA